MGVLSLMVLLLWISVESEQSDGPVWCGKPPTCKCFLTMRRIHCADIEKLPKFQERQTKTVKTIIITSPNLCEFPDQILNKSEFTSLKTINVLKTCMKCKLIQRYHSQRTDLNIISKCIYDLQAETTILNIITGRGPSGTEHEEKVTEGTTVNSSYWVTEGTTKEAKHWIMTCTPWMNVGYTLTAINVIGSIILIMIIIMKCRRKRTRCWRKCFQKVEARRTRIEEIQRRSIEDIGALSISQESVELFSAPPVSLKRCSVEREHRPKLN